MMIEDTRTVFKDIVYRMTIEDTRTVFKNIVYRMHSESLMQLT